MNKRWVDYFLNICSAVSTNSRCQSRQIGAVLVQDNIIISTGYNGPPRGFPHCGSFCPRKDAGYGSGEGLELCPSTHAEQNCVASAARLGHRTKGSTLYMNSVAPCKWCMGILINAGIQTVVVGQRGWYDEMAKDMAIKANITVLYMGAEDIR